MRFMIIVKATKDSEAGVLPSEQLLAKMGAFNEALVKAGMLPTGGERWFESGMTTLNGALRAMKFSAGAVSTAA